MEDKECNIYIVSATVYQCWDLSIITCWASVFNLITVCRGGRTGGFYVAGWVETSCVWRDAVVWRYACSTSAATENPPARPPLHTVIRFNTLAHHVIMPRSQHWYILYMLKVVNNTQWDPHNEWEERHQGYPDDTLPLAEPPVSTKTAYSFCSLFLFLFPSTSLQL